MGMKVLLWCLTFSNTNRNSLTALKTNSAFMVAELLS